MDDQDEEIIIKIPLPPITSLVFEGGGVKGIAYAGAYKALKEEYPGLLDKLHWVAGSSAGAMTALLIALNFTPDEIEAELSSVNFSEFAEPLPDGRLSTIHYILKHTNKISKNLNHGINDGKKLYHWVQKIFEKKLGTKEATFLDLKTKSDSHFSKSPKDLLSGVFKYKNLLIIVTNALKNKTEIFSWETTPNLQIADAVLTSMSIPGFFYVRYIDNEKNKIDWNPTREKITSHKIIPYVDGGVLNNYPINIFHDYKYWLPEYYALVKSHHFNPSSLGIRVDSKEEVLDLIDIRHHEIISLQQIAESEEFAMGPRVALMPSPSKWFINPEKIFDMTNKFVTLLTSDLNKVKQYCQRTIAIYDCDIQTTQFSLTEADKVRLKESGKASVNGFFKEYFKNDSFKKFRYRNRRELEEDIQAKNELIKILSNLKHKHTHERELMRLKLENELAKKKILELDKEPALKFFKSSEASTSETRKKVAYSKSMTDKIEENLSIETSSSPEALGKQDKVVMPLKLDDKSAEKNSSRSGWCCWR